MEKEPVKLKCRFGWKSGDPKPTIKWFVKNMYEQ
jgi:hypothetical protein